MTKVHWFVSVEIGFGLGHLYLKRETIREDSEEVKRILQEFDTKRFQQDYLTLPIPQQNPLLFFPPESFLNGVIIEVLWGDEDDCEVAKIKAAVELAGNASDNIATWETTEALEAIVSDFETCGWQVTGEEANWQGAWEDILRDEPVEWTTAMPPPPAGPQGIHIDLSEDQREAIRELMTDRNLDTWMNVGAEITTVPRGTTRYRFQDVWDLGWGTTTVTIESTQREENGTNLDRITQDAMHVLRGIFIDRPSPTPGRFQEEAVLLTENALQRYARDIERRNGSTPEFRVTFEMEGRDEPLVVLIPGSVPAVHNLFDYRQYVDARTTTSTQTYTMPTPRPQVDWIQVQLSVQPEAGDSDDVPTMSEETEHNTDA